ncbi:hypothetical protein V1525DRAFT_404003 [Lipomyces kononenkoae]|uniref:Uncharacterized protein n=1 Tax=Lipomyces kononenkoae TaxID=34357 RepID=A0ACC3T0R9_LIPKO
MAARTHKQRSKLHAAQAAAAAAQAQASAAAAAAAAHAANGHLSDNPQQDGPPRLRPRLRPQSPPFDKDSPAATHASPTKSTTIVPEPEKSTVNPSSHAESLPLTTPHAATTTTTSSSSPDISPAPSTTASQGTRLAHSERSDKQMRMAPSTTTAVVETVDGPKRLDAAIDVIRRQFDLEILLKHRELSCIEDEIAKVHIMMVQLRRCAGKTIDGQDEPDDFAKHYAQYLLPDRRYSECTRPDLYNKSPEGVSPTSAAPDSLDAAAGGAGMQSRSRSIPTTNRMHLPQYSTNGTVGGNPPPEGCIYRRPDGILVRLVCKDCSRITFGSAQGFINHCRISHGREFTSHDNAAQCCGEELKESDQDDIGLGALKHRRHMQMSSAGPMLSPSPVAPPPPPSNQTDVPSATTVNTAELVAPDAGGVNAAAAAAAAAKRDYGTKSFPWNYHASSTSFLNQPITPPSDDQIPRQVSTELPTVAADVAAVPVTSSTTTAATTTQPNTAGMTVSTTSMTPTPTATPFMPTLPAPPPPPTRHLSSLLKRKQVEVDLDHMAAESVKRDPLGHLFPGEEDVSDDEEETRLPSVAKYRKLAGAQRGRPLGSGMRIVASLH